MNESEQAQTIAEIKADREHRARLCKGAVSMERRWRKADMQLGEVLEIVESQAQKIKEQAARISELEKEAREHVCCLANNGW